MSVLVEGLLREIRLSSVLMFLDWDAVADNSRPLRLYVDAGTNGFGASLKQEQVNDFVRHIVISRATFPANAIGPCLTYCRGWWYLVGF